MSTSAQQIKSHVQQELDKVLFGISHHYDFITTAIIAGGNVLITGAPGTGKSLLSKALIRLLNPEVARIDCGNDIEFTNILHALSATAKNPAGISSTELLYLPGLNRLSPNTQAILLPVMEEHQLINNGQTLKMPADFRVIATYDPSCYDDTFPLLTALLDRFYISLTLSALPADQEIALLKASDYPLGKSKHKIDASINPLSSELVNQARAECQAVAIPDQIYEYLVQISTALRHYPDIQGGISQRGPLSVINTAKIHAMLHDRNSVVSEDIRAVLPYCLTHRIRLSTDAMLDGKVVTDILNEVLSATESPVNAPD